MAQKNNKRGKRTPAYSTDTMVVCLIVGLLLIALGVLIFLANALNMSGDVFDGLRQFSRGMCGMLAIVLPVIPVWGGVLVMLSTQRKPPVRPYVLACVIFFLLCTVFTLCLQAAPGKSLMMFYKERVPMDTMPAYLSIAFRYGYQGGGMGYGGGLCGMLLAWPLWKAFGAVFGSILSILSAIISFLFLIRLDVKGLLAKAKAHKEQRRAQQQAQEAQQRQQELAWQQEQMRIRQEQARMQEQLRQQQIQQQLQQQQMQQAQQQSYQQNYQQSPYAQPQGDPYGQAVPVVQQVQTRNQAQSAPRQHGFQPTPEELGQTAAPQPMPEPARKKRGGIFSRDKGDDAVAIPRKKNFFDRAPEEEAVQQPVPVRQQPAAAPVFPSEEEPPRRRIRQPAKPEWDEPEITYTQEPDIFAEAEQQPVKPAPRSAGRKAAAQAAPAVQAAPAAQPAPIVQAAPVMQSAPAAPARKAVQPPEEIDTGFAAEAEEKPASENSFLARLRAAKKAAGMEVPEEPAPKTSPRPTARAAVPAAPAVEDAWAETPPWEETPVAAAPAAPLRPVVTQKKPEGGYEPDLNLKPRRAGSDLPPAMFDEPKEVPYVFPGMDLLKAPEPQAGISPEEDELRSRRLENTLQSFRVPAKVRHITHGPAISRFELELAAGIKVSKVTDLNRNIAMNMEVKSVRIEAPIPGKSLVGVEVPNKQRATVTLREVLESEPMRKANKPLVVALGKDIAGTPIVCDLAKMPHLLIAGATGSGKSVCINTIINSLLYRCSPKEVRLILVDPKVVELQCYNGIPHLLIPVVSDPHKASGALAWAVGEMMDRYKRFQEAGVRAIDGYNEQMGKNGEKMPRIVIIIDELADLMMTCKKDVEERICRLAQLARAAGIHLIVATQRPSVDVITGLIKANIPSRIAFKVSSNVDSRTILDRIGAEQLLGYGDMLYMPTGEFTPIRVQGCFLSDPEVNRITDFIRENCPSDYDPAVLEELERLQAESDQNNGGGSLPDMPAADDYVGGDGSLLTQCIEMAVQDGQVSTSLIQRRLRLGYARAGRLVDEMEKRGIVGPKDGAKPRMCLISREEFEAMKAAGELD
ncbi:MAG: DUF87 domain-containing protein [Clostridia bacterium]|nr:DUF87 domain-containing protein [Clostridia bacterium]